MIHPNVVAWRKQKRHLPRFMKDFHDCKDLFKTMHELTTPASGEQHDVPWPTGMVYVIDVFLWFMARHGYTLQKTRAKLEFEDIEHTVSAQTARRQQQESQVLLSVLGKKETP